MDLADTSPVIPNLLNPIVSVKTGQNAANPISLRKPPTHIVNI